jgi:hypothetical protein
MEHQPRQQMTTIVDHTIYGIYVWQLPSGEYFNDGNENYLSIASVRGDIQKMMKLQRAAEHHGQPIGTPIFLAGNRKISDAEYANQWERHLRGEIADEYDVGAILGELRQQKLYGGN